MSWLHGVRRLLPRRRSQPSAGQELTPEERAALELAGYDEIAQRARAGSADAVDVVSPGSVDSSQGWSIRGGS